MKENNGKHYILCYILTQMSSLHEYWFLLKPIQKLSMTGSHNLNQIGKQTENGWKDLQSMRRVNITMFFPWYLSVLLLRLPFVAWLGMGNSAPRVGRRLFWRACGHVWRTERCHSDCCYCVGPKTSLLKIYGGILVRSWWMVRKLWVHDTPVIFFSRKINECNICSI